MTKKKIIFPSSNSWQPLWYILLSWKALLIEKDQADSECSFLLSSVYHGQRVGPHF